jgi:hypothetical protein
MPARDLKEFIAWLKANPNSATQGTTGAGGISTVGGLFFQKETATRFRFVPYRVGLGAAMQDLVAGQIDFMIDTAANSLPQVRTGTIKAFAVTGRQRLARAPDIPTVGEEGLPGLQALNWQAVFLPKGVPTEVIAKLNTAVVAALADASVRRQLADIGQEIFPREQQTPEALRSFQRGRDREMVADHRSEQKANRGAVKPILVRLHGTLSYRTCVCIKNTRTRYLRSPMIGANSISDETKVLRSSGARRPHRCQSFSDSSFA